MGQNNILGVLTDPLTRTISWRKTHGSWQVTIDWRLGDASSGSYFGAHIKFAGYDGVFLLEYRKPVHLFIDNGKSGVERCYPFIGEDTYETEDSIKFELGKEMQVACIGPAGEKL